MALCHVPNVPLVQPRRKLRATLALLAGVALVPVACGGSEQAPEEEPAGGVQRFDEQRAFADLEAQVALGPRPAGSAANRRNARLLARKLRRAGVEGVRVQTPERNVVGTIPGRERGVVVVGAHHDTKDGLGPDFVGANDGASGTAVVLELARSLPRPLPGPGVAIAIFDAEEARGERPFSEDGTRGSRQYVRYAGRGGQQGSPPLEEVEAMVLFDLVGDCDLQVPREASSDPVLYEAFAEAAGGAPFEGQTGPISDDHLPFLQAGVPAVDLIDFSYGPGGTPGAWWHTERDTLDKVCAESLDAVGEAALEAIPELPRTR